MSSSAFQITDKFSEVAKIINSLPVDKFIVILKRILKRLQVINGPLFDKDEITQLLTVFSLTTTQLQNVLDCSCYIFEQVKLYIVLSNINYLYSSLLIINIYINRPNNRRPLQVQDLSHCLLF